MFVAFVPPAEVVEDLAEFLEPRFGADDRLRWSDPVGWHLTLAFMAEVGERHRDRLEEALGEVAARHTAPWITLGGAGAFPSPYDARVLWLGAAGISPDLVASVRGACVSAGVAVEGGSFTGHLTLARMRRPIEATRWLRVLDAWEPRRWEATDLCLVESHLGQGRGRRPRYELAARWPLRSHGAGSDGAGSDGAGPDGAGPDGAEG